MRNYASILPGARVRTADGFIGTVERLDHHWSEPADSPDRMVVRSDDGRWRYSIPLMFVTSATQGTFHPIVQIAVHSDELAHYILEEVHGEPQDGAAIADEPTTVLDARELPQDDVVARMPVVEEQLIVRKQPVVRGKVHIRKSVETAEQHIALPVYHEEAIVEHIPPDQYDGMASSNPNEVIVPVIEERLVIQKQSVVKEYIRVRKQLISEHKEVRGTVRHEVVEVTEERQQGVADDTYPLMHQADTTSGEPAASQA